MALEVRRQIAIKADIPESLAADLGAVQVNLRVLINAVKLDDDLLPREPRRQREMFPIPAHGAGIAVCRAHQRDAHVVRNTRRGPGRIIESRRLRPGNVSGLDFPVFIDPQLDAAFEIFLVQPFGQSRADIVRREK